MKQIYIQPSTHQKLKEAAAKLGKSMAEIGEEALNLYLKKIKA